MSHGKSFHCLMVLTIKQSLFVDFLVFIARSFNYNAQRVEQPDSCTMEKLSSATKLSACKLCSRMLKAICVQRIKSPTSPILLLLLLLLLLLIIIIIKIIIILLLVLLL